MGCRSLLGIWGSPGSNQQCDAAHQDLPAKSNSLAASQSHASTSPAEVLRTRSQSQRVASQTLRPRRNV